MAFNLLDVEDESRPLPCFPLFFDLLDLEDIPCSLSFLRFLSPFTLNIVTACFTIDENKHMISFILSVKREEHTSQRKFKMYKLESLPCQHQVYHKRLGPSTYLEFYPFAASLVSPSLFLPQQEGTMQQKNNR